MKRIAIPSYCATLAPLAIALVALLAGCNVRLTPEELERQQQREAYLQLDQELDLQRTPTVDTFNRVDRSLESSDLVPLDPASAPAVPKAGLYRRTTLRVVEHSLKIANEAKGVFSPTIVFPGNILSLKGAQSSQWLDAPDLIPYRKALPFYVNVLNGRPNAPVTPDDMRPESVSHAINSLLGQDIGSQPTRLLYVVSPVYSKDDLLRTIGFEEGDPLVSPLLRWARFEAYRKTFVVYIEQRLLSLVCSTPEAGAKGIFAPTDAPSELAGLLRNYRDEGLAYVSEVNYGRTFILLFQEAKLAYLTTGDAMRAIMGIFDSSLSPSQREGMADTLLRGMSVAALQVGGQGLITVAPSGKGIQELYEKLTQTAAYKDEEALEPTSFSLRMLGSSRPVYFPKETKRTYREEVYVDQNAHSALSIVTHSLEGAPLPEPEGGYIKRLSEKSEFRLDAITIEKRINGEVVNSYKVLGAEKYPAIKGFSRSLGGWEYKFDKLDPYNSRGLEIRVILEARLYGERYLSAGEQVAVRREAIITFDPIAGRWNCNAPQAADGSYQLDINQLADYCRFRANLSFGIVSPDCQ